MLDMSASTTTTSATTMTTALDLDELEQAVLEAYFSETDAALLSRFELSLASNSLSIKDLPNEHDGDGDDGVSSSSSSSSRDPFLLEVLEEWRTLVSVLKKGAADRDDRGSGVFVFGEHVGPLMTAFRALLSGEVDCGDRALYRPLKALVHLLGETAAAENDNHNSNSRIKRQRPRRGRQDNESSSASSAATAAAIECRFVTLLEVLLSYRKGWSPTEAVSRAWASNLPQEEEELHTLPLPPDLPPVSFRRKAYRVLVSLPWVPSSQGLLEACSFEAGRQTVDVGRAPPRIRRHFDRIRGGRPQPRYDCVNQVLNRLKDDERICLCIASAKQGMGKTTLAALVASHPSILSLYRVLWLALPEKELTYETYTKCLDDLGEQLAIDPPLEWPECAKRFEEPALRRLREEAAMERARDRVAGSLLDRDENYLLILDDVENEKEIDLFRFHERQSIIATTTRARSSSLGGVNWTLDLLPMCEEEVISLFLTEANFPPAHVLGLTTEVRTIIRKCEYHPLTVRTVGRWYGLKQVTAGIVEGMTEVLKDLDEVLKELSSYLLIDGDEEGLIELPVIENGVLSEKVKVDRVDDDPVSGSDSEVVAADGQKSETSDTRTGKENQHSVQNGGDTEDVTEADDDEGVGSEVGDKGGPEQDKLTLPLLFEILNRFIGPFNVEGDSNTVIFMLCVTSMVVVFPERAPLDSVILLWEQLLWLEPSAINEISQTRDPTRADIRKRAWLIAEGLSYMGLITVVDRNGNPWVEVHHRLYKEFAMHSAQERALGATYAKSAEEWNKAYVTAYFTRRMEGKSDHSDDSSWEYAMEKLPFHVNRAKMSPMAETILGEEHFFRGRIDAMGWNRAVDMHIEDCVDLQQAVEEMNNESPENAQQFSPVFNTMSVLASTQAEDVLKTTEDNLVIELSRLLYKIGFALAANGYYDEATEQFESALNLAPQSEELVASILYGSGWALLAANMSEKALRKLRASRKVMEEYDGDHVLYKEVLQLQGEALLGECEYRDAAELLEEVVLWLKSNAAESKIELGTTFSKIGRVHHVMGEAEKATEAFNESLDWKLAAGETSTDLSSVLSALGDMNMENRNLSSARGYYVRALQVLDSLNVDPDETEYSLLRGKLNYLNNDFADSLESLELTRQAISEAPKLFTDQSAYDLRCIARCYYMQGELAAASSVLQDSLVLTNERTYSLERSFGLYDLANCVLDQNMTKEGLLCLEQSLEIRILKLGECALVMDTLSMIGNVQMLLGNSNEALPVFEKVYELTLQITPDDSMRMAKALYSVGDAKAAKKDLREAKEKVLESMALLHEAGSADSPDVARALNRLGDIEAAGKHLPVANGYYGEALRIRQKHSNRREIAETLHSVGVLTRRQNDLEAALEPLLEALDIRRELGPRTKTGQTLLELGHVLRLRSKVEDAVRCYEESLDFLDDNDENKASAYLALGHAKLAMKRDGGVLLCYESALAIRMAKLGRDSMKTANVHRSLGLFQYLVLHGDEALMHLNEYMRVVELDSKEGNGGNHTDEEDDDDDDGGDIDYVVAVTLMIDVHRSCGRDAQATNLLDLAKEVCDESEVIRRELPALVEMVERRLTPPDSDSTARRGGLLSQLSRLNLSEEAGTQLSVSAEDAAVLRNLPFVDD